MPRNRTTVTTPLLYTTPWSLGSSCQAVLGSIRVHRSTTATETFAQAPYRAGFTDELNPWAVEIISGPRRPRSPPGTASPSRS